MDSYFVFQHNFACYTYHRVLDIDTLLQDPELRLLPTHLSTELLGSPCLFKTDYMQEGLIFGRLTLDEDLDISVTAETDEGTLQFFHFPRAEYLFLVHDKPLKALGTSYQIMQKRLRQNDLEAVFHPILVFPDGLPANINEHTVIEIWLATNAPIDSDDRLSDELPEALPRKRFNFYTW